MLGDANTAAATRLAWFTAGSRGGAHARRMTAAVTDERDQALATELMRGFADRTGLSSARAPRRYLWTDAFAVCNFMALAR